MKAITTWMCAAVLGFAGAVCADEPGAAKKADGAPAKAKSGDDELLQDLTKDLFEGLDAPKKNKPADPLDAELSKDLGLGEDVGKENDPLAEIGRQMRQVESLLAEQRTGEVTQQKQAEIAAEIDKLLEQIKKNAKKSQQQASSRSQQNREQTNQQPQKPGQPGQEPGQQERRNPRDSTDRVTQGNVQDVNRQQALDLMKQSWGHLPQHVREALANVVSERNLPKYEGMIREYFERLSELDQEKR